MPNIHIATLVIIAANILLSLKGFNDFSFFEKYKFNIAGIRRGEQIRFFSSGFLHIDFTHLLFNMLTLYFFAGLVNINVEVVINHNSNVNTINKNAQNLKWHH